MNQRPKKYHTHKLPMGRISLSISPEMLKIVDEAAEKDFTTRSDVIRVALLWYLRSSEAIKQRRGLTEIRKTVKDIGPFAD